MRHVWLVLVLASLSACSGSQASSADDDPPACEKDIDCALHDPKNPCVPKARCQAGACVPVAAVDCSGIAAPMCFESKCNAANGECTFSEINYIPCDDGDACTDSDECLLGECVPGATKQCGDSTACRTYACDPVVGCRNDVLALGADCDDGDACTLLDVCDGLGGCLTGPNDCDDGNPCTVDSCDASAGCQHTPAEQTSCQDGDPCTIGDHCEAGACVGAAADNGTPCVTSACLTGQTCMDGVCAGAGTPVADGTECEEDFACVGLATCQGGACVGAAEGCPDDGNPCTVDTCTPNQGCLYLPANNGGPCDLGPCATGGTCEGGLCLKLTYASDGTPCDNGTGCATGETCTAGACGGGEAVACLPATPGPLPGGMLVTDNAANVVVHLDAFGNRAQTFEGALAGAAGVAVDRTAGDGFYVTYTGVGGAHTFVKMGWDGSALGQVESKGPWPLTGPCRDRASSTGTWLVSDCGSSVVAHDYAGNVQFASALVASDARGISVQGPTAYWLLTSSGQLRHVTGNAPIPGETYATGVPQARGLEMLEWGFYVGAPTLKVVIQVDRKGRRVRTRALPRSVDLWDFASVGPG